MPSSLERPATAAGTGPTMQRAELLKRAEVRDVVAWMRLLIEPRDAAAAVRALARPPIELRQVDLAACDPDRPAPAPGGGGGARGGDGGAAAAAAGARADRSASWSCIGGRRAIWIRCARTCSWGG